MRDAVIGTLLLGLLTVIAVLVSVLKGRGQQLQDKRIKIQDLEIAKTKAEAASEAAKATDDELDAKLADVLSRAGVPPGKPPGERG